MAALSIDSTAGLKPTTGVGGTGVGQLSSFNANIRALSPEIMSASASTGVDAKLIAAVINAESAGNPAIVCGQKRSCAGAIGAMQLMPGTARQLGVSDPCNAGQNIMGGAKYLGMLLKEYGGNVDRAIRAYNAGPGNENTGKAANFTETKNYLVKVKAAYAGSGGKDNVSVAGLAPNPKFAVPGKPGAGQLSSFFDKLMALMELDRPLYMGALIAQVREQQPDQASAAALSDDVIKQAILANNTKIKFVEGQQIPKGTVIHVPILDATSPDCTDYRSAAPAPVELKPNTSQIQATPDPRLGRVFIPPTAA